MNMKHDNSLGTLLEEIALCNVCRSCLPNEPRPVLVASSTARILVIGQAPGVHVHTTGIPWNDASGKRLRQWMQLDPEQFYDSQQIAIVPMGLCYPGSGKSGDLPPRPECAPLWHQRLLSLMPDIRCTLLIGQYAQRFYLQRRQRNLTETVRNWREYAPERYVLPHPSGRNQLWLKRNPWLEEEVIPDMRRTIHAILAS